MVVSPYQVEEVELVVADTSGENVDNKRRLEVLKMREKLIQEEEEEKMKEVRWYLLYHHDMP